MANLKDSKPRTVRLPPDLDSRIEAVADQEHRTPSSLIRHILATAPALALPANQPTGEAA